MAQWISNLQLLSHQSVYCVPIFWTLAYSSFCKRSLPRCHLTYLLAVLPAFWIVILVNFDHEIWKGNLSLERRHVSSDLFLHYDRFFYYFLISWCSMYSGGDDDINVRIKYFSVTLYLSVRMLRLFQGHLGKVHYLETSHIERYRITDEEQRRNLSHWPGNQNRAFCSSKFTVSSCSRDWQNCRDSIV